MRRPYSRGGSQVAQKSIGLQMDICADVAYFLRMCYIYCIAERSAVLNGNETGEAYPILRGGIG